MGEVAVYALKVVARLEPVIQKMMVDFGERVAEETGKYFHDEVAALTREVEALRAREAVAGEMARLLRGIQGAFEAGAPVYGVGADEIDTVLQRWIAPPLPAR